MPFVHVRIAGERAALPETARRIGAEATRLMAEVLGKDASLTAVLVEPAPLGGWTVGGAAVSAAAHLEARVTAGTNAPHEIARFVERAHALLAEAVGPGLPEATYVVVVETPAADWGYGGRTQAARRPPGA